MIRQLTSETARTIYCAGCEKNISARLTTGAEIYPDRPDLYSLPFWICDWCNNYVGCHHKTVNPTTPLGIIPTKKLRYARRQIHLLLDPLWQSNRIKRGQAYAYVEHRLGRPYHNGEIKTLDEARDIYRIVATLHNEILEGVNSD